MNRHLRQRTFALLLLVAGGLFGCNGSQPVVDVEKSKRIAGELRDNKLFSAAIDEYKQVLLYGDIDDSQRGNLSFLIGRMYFDDLKDYGSAAAWLVRAREYNPDANYSIEAAEKLVAALERMGHSFDAKRQLTQAASIDRPEKRAGDVEVARIGNDPIYLSEVEKHMQGLPAQIQSQLGSPAARRQFMRQYVGVQLLYRAAMREGYGKDPEVLERQDQMLKSLIVQKYMSEKVLPELNIDTVDVRNYFLANQGRYGDRPYDSVKSQVYMDYQSEKAESAYGDYIDRLAQAEHVEFLDQNIK